MHMLRFIDRMRPNRIVYIGLTIMTQQGTIMTKQGTGWHHCRLCTKIFIILYSCLHDMILIIQNSDSTLPLNGAG